MLCGPCHRRSVCDAIQPERPMNGLCILLLVTMAGVLAFLLYEAITRQISRDFDPSGHHSITNRTHLTAGFNSSAFKSQLWARRCNESANSFGQRAIDSMAITRAPQCRC